MRNVTTSRARTLRPGDGVRRTSRLALLAVVAALAVTTASPLSAQPAPAGPDSVGPPTVHDKVEPLRSAPARDLPAAPPTSSTEVNPLQGGDEVIDLAETGRADPVAQLDAAEGLALNQLGAPIVNVPGQGGANPNDTNGDIGPNDYVQMINSNFQIFDRQGTPRGPSAAINTLWASNPAGQNACSTQNAGDPIVLYDRQADRWLLSQFAQTQFLCIAISQTPDPTGAYFLYQFTVDRFPDYFKIGIWPDGYYISANFNGPNTAMATVVDRANMLNGNPAGQVDFEIPTLVNNFDVLIPSNMEGPTPPPAGTPNYFYRQIDGDIIGGSDRLELWEFQTDWIVPANSTLTGPTDINTAPFDSDTCGYGFVQCIDQPGTAQQLDPIQIGTMYRLPYRNYGDREVMVGNFTVDADGNDGVGIRWFMLERSGGGGWGIVNEGTYAPQPGGAQPFIHRWMGSANVDRFGNMALGYSASSSANIFPSARYTGRDADDPLGLMPATEFTIQAGQAATTGNRWGDYYTLSVDPVDDCTFWYTGDATAANGSRQSRIASFRFDDCATDLAITKTVSPEHPNAGEEAVYTITVDNQGDIPADNVVVIDELPPEVDYLTDTDSCTGVAVGATGTLTCDLGLIGPGQSRSFQIKVVIGSDLGGATSITNVATVDSDANESNPSDNEASLTHLVNESADVRVTKLCKPDTGPAPAGTEGTCSILVTNDGPSAAREVELVDTHISDGAFALATTTAGCVTGAVEMTCALGTIQAGETVQADVVVTSNDGVDVNDVAIASSATPDPNNANNQAEAGLTFDASADLSITKTGPVTAVPGTTFDYTITVDNAGPSDAQDVVVNDELPPDVDFVSATESTGSWTANDGTVTWNVGDVAVSDPPATITITVFVHEDATGQLVNNAAVTSATSDPNGSNNLATWTTDLEAQAELTVTKDDSPDPVVAGSELTYTVTVGNNGPSTATDVVVTDTLPDDTTLVSAVGGTGSTACAQVQPNIVSCEVGALAPGATETIFITVLVDSAATGTLLNEVEATSPTDPDGASDSETTEVITEADLWMEKRGEASAGNPAGALTYTLVVHNHPGSAPDDTPTSGDGGPSDAQDVVVVDPLPLTSKKMNVQFLTPGCTYDEGTHTVTCTADTVPYGTSVEFEVQVDIKGSVGSITNVATASSSTPDPVLANNADTVNNVVKGSTGKGKKPN